MKDSAVPTEVQVVDTLYSVEVRPKVFVDREQTAGSFSGTEMAIQIARATRERMRWACRHETFHAAEHEVAEKELNDLLGQRLAIKVSEIYAGKVIPAYLAALENAGLIEIKR